MPSLFRKPVDAGRCVSPVFLPAVERGRKFAAFALAMMLCSQPSLGNLAEQETQRVSFIARRDFRVGGFPISVAVGDFNGDGKLDLAVADEGTAPLFMDGGVSVLLGNGDGTFQEPRNFAAGRSPFSVAVGDFNGDGQPDLAVANNGSNDVSVLLGNGDGTFQPAQNFAGGSGPVSVAVADFNGDGVQDLAVANRGSNDVSMLLGNGDGTFQPAQNFDVGSGPQSVAVGDFNGDGLQDLVIANRGSAPSFADSSVSVLLGNGDGTFQLASNFTFANPARSVAVGDFNGDGNLDLAVSSGPINLFGGVFVLLGNGDGTFQPGQDLVVGVQPDSVAIGDFNGDGKPDLAVANAGSSNVSVLTGNGDGTFQAAQSFDAGSASISVAVGDFNGDGVQDLAVANANAKTVSLLLGNGDGTFLEAASLSGGSSFLASSVAVGDFNRDGVPDLAVADSGTFSPGGVWLLLGNGDGSFQPPAFFATGRGAGLIAVGDFNGDGLLDLAVADFGAFSTGDIWVLLGNGDGTFQPAQHFASGGHPFSVAVGDFNGDGVQDLALANRDSNNVSVLLGNGDGTFQPAQNFGAGSGPVWIALGDFNGDGIQDLAVANNTLPGNVSILLGNGDGTFQAAQGFGSDSFPVSAAVGDFNRDGIQDLAVANVGRSPDAGTVSVLLGMGDGTFQPAQNFVVGVEPTSMAIGDFNGDGIQDLAVTNGKSNNVSILLGNGDGTFQPAEPFGVGQRPISVAAGDFNGDGKLDLAVANSNVSVLINDTPTQSHPVSHARGADSKRQR